MKLWHFERDTGSNSAIHLVCMAETRESAWKEMRAIISEEYNGKMNHYMDKAYLSECNGSTVEINDLGREDKGMRFLTVINHFMLVLGWLAAAIAVCYGGYWFLISFVLAKACEKGGC